ncbi:MAG TPA: VWA domain-containing protein [Alphaproteobacteria bacterium]|nr:VWA domain-containing protein [Alphaproteobacteria bacterium]
MAEFLAEAARVPAPRTDGCRGRLLFAMDATASREPSWDRACQIQGEMFLATEALGGLEVQLVFYRGFGECKASPWVTSADALVRRMSAVLCRSGQTQIAKVLRHAIAETKRRKVNALVFVGDCMEESADELRRLAGELGLLGVPAFMFHEGDDPVAARCFRDIARLTGGAYCAFDAASAQQLRELLGAVAAYAAGGRPALEDYGRTRGKAARLLTRQLG